MPEDVLSTEQAAGYLGLSLRQVYKLVARGELAPVRTSRALRFPREDLEAFVEAHRIRPGDLIHLVPPQQRRYAGHGG